MSQEIFGTPVSAYSPYYYQKRAELHENNANAAVYPALFALAVFCALGAFIMRDELLAAVTNRPSIGGSSFFDTFKINVRNEPSAGIGMLGLLAAFFVTGATTLSSLQKRDEYLAKRDGALGH